MAQIQKTASRLSQPVLRLGTLAWRGFAERGCGPGELRVFVIHTSAQVTRAALSAVATLARQLDARVTLLAVEIVPFSLPLDRPAVPPSFLEQQLRALSGSIEAQVDVQLVLARDREVGIRRLISPRSLVVVATRKRWWPTWQNKLARSLARAGHSVALLEV